MLNEKQHILISALFPERYQVILFYCKHWYLAWKCFLVHSQNCKTPFRDSCHLERMLEEVVMPSWWLQLAKQNPLFHENWRSTLTKFFFKKDWTLQRSVRLKINAAFHYHPLNHWDWECLAHEPNNFHKTIFFLALPRQPQIGIEVQGI